MTRAKLFRIATGLTAAIVVASHTISIEMIAVNLFTLDTTAGICFMIGPIPNSVIFQGATEDLENSIAMTEITTEILIEDTIEIALGLVMTTGKGITQAGTVISSMEVDKVTQQQYGSSLWQLMPIQGTTHNRGIQGKPGIGVKPSPGRRRGI